MTDRLNRGIEIFREVYGDAAADGLTAHLKTDSFGVEQAQLAMEWAFGTVWARDGLDRKIRSAAVLGMLIALRHSSEISHHTKMGIANGLTKKEIEEILYTAIPYCGLPASNVAKDAMRSALDDLERA